MFAFPNRLLSPVRIGTMTTSSVVSCDWPSAWHILGTSHLFVERMNSTLYK